MTPTKDLPEPKSLAELAEAAGAGAGSGLGIICPKCGCIQFAGKHVRNTVKTTGAIRRYRVCRHCGHTWTTTER